jgi:hypothetical protein
VIEIGTGRDDPVDKARLDQRNERRHSQPGRCQSTGDRETDRYIWSQHFSGEELTRFAQTRRVVGEIGPFDQLGDCLLAVDAAGIDPLPLEKAACLVRGVLLSLLLALFGGELLLGLGAGG